MKLAKVGKCRSCGTLIVFISTKRGKQMPVNAEFDIPYEAIFDPKVHTSHFSTCEQASQHRRPR